MTAAVALRLTHDGRLALDEPLGDQLAPELLRRWRGLDALPHTTPRQLLAHTAGLPNYFRDESFLARLREEPGRPWRPVEWAVARRYMSAESIVRALTDPVVEPEEVVASRQPPELVQARMARLGSNTT